MGVSEKSDFRTDFELQDTYQNTPNGGMRFFSVPKPYLKDHGT